MDPAGTTRIGFEEPNALGALWRLQPRLAAKCTRAHNYAKAVQTMLRALDLYCHTYGVSPSRLRVRTTLHEGRIVQRISS